MENESLLGKIDCIYGESAVKQFWEIYQSDPEGVIPKAIDTLTKFVIGDTEIDWKFTLTIPKTLLPLCEICRVNEATEQLPNESCLYVCYGCKVAQREVI